MITTNLLVTAYCACTLCCGKHATGKTASGIKPTQGITVAASRQLPFGTRLFIDGVGWRTVQDRLAKRYDNRVDVYFASHAQAKQFGISQRKVVISEKK